MDMRPFLSIWQEDGDLDGAPGSEGLPFEAGDCSPVRPVTEKAKKGFLASASGDPNDLRLQRWGVVIPEGSEALLDGIKELCALRAEQQGAEAIVYKVKPAMTTAEAEDFIDREYWDKVGRDTARLPQYLLILGDADDKGVSWQLQQALGRHGVFAGRLPFDEEGHYRAYASKVKQWERAPLAERDAVFFVSKDASSLVVEARPGLVAPAMKTLEAQGASFGKTVVRVKSVELQARAEETLAGLLDVAGKTSGATLFTVSHGVGISLKSSAGEHETRRKLQGGLVVGPDCVLSGDRVKSGPFLPGGAWFFFACFSAGTPAESAYAPWLERLNRSDIAAQAMSTLAGPGEAAFAAELPRAALANPEGPLAVIGHVDLAWSWSFSAVRDADIDRPEPRAERLSNVLRAWLQGARFGPSHRELSSAATSVGETLLSSLVEASDPSLSESPQRKDQNAYDWLEYQDLNAYVLLGDPAAALPGSRVFERREAPVRAAAAPERPFAKGKLKLLESAILSLLPLPCKEAELRQVATDLDLETDELRRRVEAYQNGARRALLDYLSAADTSKNGEG